MTNETLHGTRHAAAVLSESVHEAAEGTREAISDAFEHGQKRAGHLYDRAADVARGVGHRSLEQYHALRGHVQRNVMMTTLVAFAGGFVIARFLFRR